MRTDDKVRVALEEGEGVSAAHVDSKTRHFRVALRRESPHEAAPGKLPPFKIKSSDVRKLDKLPY